MMTIAAAAAALKGRIVGGDARFSAVSTDTRSIGKGELFVALRGERFDGHDYLQTARDAGASAAMVASDSELQSAPLPLLVVDDTRLGLGDLAKHWRGGFDVPVIAIAGSNGKTTVKEMTAAIAKEHFGDAAVLATAGNFNNDIGLPLTVLRMRSEHACAVIEVGMNHPGETAYLAAIAQPTVAVINNAQREHQEFMKSVTDVAEEHSAVLAALEADGVAVFNADDAHAPLWRKAAGSREQRGFGLSESAAVRASYRATAQSSELLIETPEGHIAAHLDVPGLHNVRNALAATAAATAAGASLQAVARGLMKFRAVSGRLQTKVAGNGVCVIDDTYNANPDSVIAAIDVLAYAGAPRILVLGDMGEVGGEGAAFHAEIGAHARAKGIEKLYTLGELAGESTRSFGSGAEHMEDIDSLIEQVRTAAQSGATVLVKGSRFMRMERVVRALTGELK
jgi:UDP-N-acetylmuramoyl-tripeptide--D-alanyl-D-alanine ligase